MRVFTNGCFDVLHVGHLNLLIHARELAGAGRLIVAVDEDEKIMAQKGLSRPVFHSHERAKALCDLRYQGKPMVDQVEFFHTDLELEMLIKRLMPDLIVKGSDWEGRKVVGANVAKVEFYPRSEYSSSEIIIRCQKNQ